jgi:hypothetical protein
MCTKYIRSLLTYIYNIIKLKCVRSRESCIVSFFYLKTKKNERVLLSWSHYIMSI